MKRVPSELVQTNRAKHALRERSGGRFATQSKDAERLLDKAARKAFDYGLRPSAQDVSITNVGYTQMKGVPSSSIRKSAGKLWVALWLLLLLAAAPSGALAAGSAPIQTFFIPVPEEEALAAYRTLAPALPDQTIHTVIGIAAGANNTVVYYDHWEDGYEADISHPVQASTRILGDALVGNGAPPGCAAVSCDVINAGAVLLLQDDVYAAPRDPAVIRFDGRDKIAATGPVAVTRVNWGTTTGPLIVDALEVYPTSDWGMVYEAPAGENSTEMFEDTRWLVLAAFDNTAVTVDVNGDGLADLTRTLGQGGSLTVDGVRMAARLTASLPVQVAMLTGDIGATYESRWFTLLPSERWGSSYLVPIGTTNVGDEAAVLIFNPHQAGDLTVTVTTAGGASALVVPPRGLLKYLMPVNGGALVRLNRWPRVWRPRCGG